MPANKIPKRVLVYTPFSSALYSVKVIRSAKRGNAAIVEMQKQIICLAKPMPENTIFKPWISEWPLKLGAQTSIKHL